MSGFHTALHSVALVWGYWDNVPPARDRNPVLSSYLFYWQIGGERRRYDRDNTLLSARASVFDRVGWQKGMVMFCPSAFARGGLSLGNG
ncbi:MAG: hypothetical protein IKZ54_10710 [Bacteroidales bacterium]|nr:hypothetical protein [Bacteroidales bacterium]